MRCSVKEKGNSVMSTYIITHLSTIDKLHFPKNATGAWIYQVEGESESSCEDLELFAQTNEDIQYWQ